MTTTVEFYKLYHVNPDDNAPKIQDCIKSLIGKTHIYNNGDLPRDLYNLLELSHGYIGGVFRKVRPDDTIEYGQVGNDGKPLELAENEGIFETNHLDSITVVAQLCPQFTAKLVKRWYELEQFATITDSLLLIAHMATQAYEAKQLALKQETVTVGDVSFPKPYKAR